jgi:toxin ParE1/3/4
MRVEYHPDLEIDLAEIRDHYNRLSPCLGDEFLNEFALHVSRIAAMPTRWMLVRGDVRRALMRRFLYVTLFRLIDVSHLRITAVKHERRHPRFGVGRR